MKTWVKRAVFYSDVSCVFYTKGETKQQKERIKIHTCNLRRGKNRIGKIEIGFYSASDWTRRQFEFSKPIRKRITSSPLLLKSKGESVRLSKCCEHT